MTIGTDELSYTYPITKLGMGGHYANLSCTIQTDRESNLIGAWCSDNQVYCGDLSFAFKVNRTSLSASSTSFFPAYQTTLYQGEGVRIEKMVFLPCHEGYPRNVFFLLSLENQTKQEQEIQIEVNLTFPAVARPDTPWQPDPLQTYKTVSSALKNGVIFSETEGNPEEVRLFGTLFSPREYELTDQTCRLVYECTLEAESKVDIPFLLTLSSRGTAMAIKGFREGIHYRSAFNRTNISVQYLLNSCRIFTPNALVNRGFQWAKVNALRLQNRGASLEPPLTVRDIMWFVSGMNYIMPDFTRDMLDLMTQYHIDESGKVLRNGESCDLNITDDTPLFIVGCYHYLVTTGDIELIRSIYPAIKKAAEWILSQMKSGLVYVGRPEGLEAPLGEIGQKSQSMASWRQPTSDLPLSGAITEINTECYRALVSFTALAQMVEEDQVIPPFKAAAETLKQTINEKLKEKEKGLYFLNIDEQGIPQFSLTGDLIFPAITGVADWETAQNILKTLGSEAFTTKMGTRTVAKGDPLYDPAKGDHYLGGIRPNLTAWVAFGSRKAYPEKVAEALETLFSICETDHPRALKHVVPGQFPERLHGETFESEGLPLSPIMGPIYLWLGIEGLLGLEPQPGKLMMKPALPADWHWVAARDIQYQGESLSLILFQGTLYSNLPISYEGTAARYDRELSDFTRANVFVIVLGKEDEVLIFCAADKPKQAEITLREEILGVEKSYSFPLKAGEAKLWKEPILKTRLVPR